jgi:hypothetical protein
MCGTAENVALSVLGNVSCDQRYLTPGGTASSGNGLTESVGEFGNPPRCNESREGTSLQRGKLPATPMDHGNYLPWCGESDA